MIFKSFIIIRYGRRKLSEYNILVGAKDNIVKLEQIEKECENDYNEVSKNLDNAQETNQNHTDTINELKSLQVEKKLNLLYAELVAEKCADQRDSVLAKQLLLDKKAGQILILGLHNAGKEKGKEKKLFLINLDFVL
ncbi:unnamed protein product [Rotaria magnacalcarata]|uniref:Uncharacterized protein n=2 Tax=Rotaria magnacalcarata TaxID=392030 RepID=A0A816MEW3_9BILA|nr:unnamed protein product [Rotaria magnacalcarata]